MKNKNSSDILPTLDGSSEPRQPHGQVLDGRRSRHLKRAFLAILLAAPALWTGYFTYRFGVDIPFHDQWHGLYPLLEKADEGGLRFVDFLRFHNEHPIFFPRLIMFGLAKLTHWNVRAEMLVVWLLACACGANFCRLAQVTGRNITRSEFWPMFVTCALLFTPLALENWTWGFQIGFLLPITCTTACFWIAPSVRFPINFLLTAALSVVCTLSIGGGVVCWLLTFPLLWRSCENIEKRRKIGLALLWLFAFLTCLCFYLRNERGGDPSHMLIEFAQRPLKAAQFFLAYLGSAFAVGTVANGSVPGRPASFWYSGVDGPLKSWAYWDAGLVAQIVGAVLLVWCVVMAGYLWRCRRDKPLVTQNLPWLMVALCALLNAVVTTVARLKWGGAQALASRYLHFSVLLPIGLVFLTPSLINHWRSGGTKRWKIRTLGTALSATAAALLLLHLVALVRIQEDWRKVQYHRLAGKAALLLVNVVDEPDMLKKLTLIFDSRSDAIDHLSLLDRLGYLRPPLVKTNAICGLIGRTLHHPREFGEITMRSAGKRWCTMAGWAVLPDKSRPADMVLLTYDDRNGEGIIFALAVAEMRRTDLRAPWRQPSFLRRSGWVKSFDVSRLPPGHHKVRAWAFDADDCRAYPLKGVANITSAPP